MSKPSKRKSRKQKIRQERLRIEKHQKKMKKSSKVLAESVDTNNKEEDKGSTSESTNNQ